MDFQENHQHSLYQSVGLQNRQKEWRCMVSFTNFLKFFGNKNFKTSKVTKKLLISISKKKKVSNR